MIRPSIADRVKACGHVAELSEKFPETNPNAERGTLVDTQVTSALIAGAVAVDPDARACLEWLAAQRGEGLTRQPWVQQKVKLMDPETGEVLTEGTPDFQYAVDVEPGVIELTTVDLKKKEQIQAGLTAGPNEGLQCHAYSAARGLEIGATRYRNVLLAFGGGQVEAIPSRWFERTEWWGVIDEFRALNVKPRIPAPGPHCGSCYSRVYCAAHLNRTALAMTTIGEKLPAKLTNEQAAELVLRAKLVQEAAALAMDIAKAHVRAGGLIEKNGKKYVPVIQEGRRSADIKALERDGIADKYMKRGSDFETWRWLRK